jgi:hypothetical protein
MFSVWNIFILSEVVMKDPDRGIKNELLALKSLYLAICGRETESSEIQEYLRNINSTDTPELDDE